MTVLNPYFSQSRRGLNPYFNYNGETGNNENEQNLISSLIAEKIQQFGIKTQYIIRTEHNKDKIFGEAPGSNFSDSFIIEMDMENPDGMADVTSLAQFGYNMANNITLHCSYRRLNNEIQMLNIQGRKYPMVGDIIWIPILGSTGTMVEIKYIDDTQPSFVTGTWMIYTLRCQTMDLGSETFSTGEEIIDGLNNFDENYLEPVTDNNDIQQEANKLIISEPNVWNELFKNQG